jgi:dipeptidyl aminopeptidase/acylaminoacyl peptidase
MVVKSVHTSLILILVFILASLSEAIARGISIEVWSLRQSISQVEVSPDGKYLALMKIESKTGNPVVEIREVADIAKKPIRFDANPMEFTSLQWVDDDYIVLNARQKVRKRIDGVNQGVYEFRLVGYDVQRKKFVTDIFDENTNIESVLPNEDGVILISKSRVNASVTEDDPFAAFRPREYYKLSLRGGAKQFVMKGNDRIAQAGFDDDANPRFAQGYDAGSREFVFYTRGIDENEWREVARQDSYDQATFSFVGVKADDPNIGYLIANNGEDKAGLWEVDLRTGEIGALLHRPQQADVIAPRFHSNVWGEGSRLVGAIYFGPRLMTEWFDPEEQALFSELRGAIPNAHNLTIASRARDDSVMTILNTGPRDPGSYYLLTDGGLAFIGSQNPLARPEDLADVRFVSYTARDGLVIPSYITVPNGQPPFPAIVLPHGGPYVSELIDYDEWGQVLANHGYLVIQPGFRGSQGWGLAHYEAGLGGEWGLAMQNDKEDAAAYLVAEGLSEADRIATFGWSYGGYSALAAATRGNDVFQCAIAGAPVADLPQAVADFTRGGIPASKYFLEQNYAGVSPEQEAENLNIPLMLVHGDVDQRVPIKHSNEMARALDRAGKDYKYVILKGADHFSNTLFQDHQELLYTSMIDFLQNDCGPDGL